MTTPTTDERAQAVDQSDFRIERRGERDWFISQEYEFPLPTEEEQRQGAEKLHRIFPPDPRDATIQEQQQRIAELEREKSGNCGNCKFWSVKGEGEGRARGECRNETTHQLIRPGVNPVALANIWKIDPADAEQITDFRTMDTFRCNQWERGQQQFPLPMVDDENEDTK